MARFKKSMLFPVISILISAFATLLVVEIALRMFQLFPTRAIGSASQDQFNSIPGIYAPNQSLIVRHVPALPHTVTINKLGYRGADFPEEKPSAEVRILFTGDSFTYGDLVDDDKTLPFQLDTLLKRHCAGVRVINGGLAGSTIDAHAALTERAARLKPDIVILMFHENDVIDLIAPLWKQLEMNRRVRSSFPMSLIFSAIQRTATYQMARKAQNQFREILRKGASASVESRQAQLEQREKMKLVYAGELRGIRERLQGRSVDFFFTMFPSHLHVGPPRPDRAGKAGEVSWYDREMIEWAENSAKAMGIPTLNLQEPLHRGLTKVEDGYLLPHDGHASPEGYRVAAEALANFAPLIEALAKKCPSPVN
jgi:lysophospholipase L1-like esterase